MKAIGRAILSAIFLVLTGLMLAAAKYAPQLVFSFYPAWSRKALAALSSVSALLPIALWEVLAGLAILWLLYTFVCIFTRRRGFLNWLTGVLLAVCVGVFLFTGLWGLNHFGPGVGETLGPDCSHELLCRPGHAVCRDGPARRAGPRAVRRFSDALEAGRGRLSFAPERLSAVRRRG